MKEERCEQTLRSAGASMHTRGTAGQAGSMRRSPTQQQPESYAPRLPAAPAAAPPLLPPPAAQQPPPPARTSQAVALRVLVGEDAGLQQLVVAVVDACGAGGAGSRHRCF